MRENRKIIKLLRQITVLSSNLILKKSQAIPNDPDGLHRLGLVLYTRGKMIRDASGADDVIQGKQGSWIILQYPGPLIRKSPAGNSASEISGKIRNS